MDPTHSNEAKSSLSYALSGKIMLSAIIFLFTVVLLILFLHLYVRWHVRHRASRRARRRQRLVFAAENQRTSAHGLDPSILASLPVLLFCHSAEENDESGECAVCLNEFKEGEKIRCLPQCTHRFHIDCIDMWFHSHSSCPLCRAEVDFVAETDSRETTTAENELEFRIEIPESRGDGTSGEEEQRSLAEEEQVKSISRMVLIRWLLVRDPRFYCGGVSGSVIDMERGDGESTVPTTATAVDQSR